jgi:hypothetical protein
METAWPGGGIASWRLTEVHGPDGRIRRTLRRLVMIGIVTVLEEAVLDEPDHG